MNWVKLKKKKKKKIFKKKKKKKKKNFKIFFLHESRHREEFFKVLYAYIASPDNLLYIFFPLKKNSKK